MRAPSPLRPGDPERIGAYRLVGLLGEGGQGAVYQGEAQNGERVAVKLLHARFSGDARARGRFAAELAMAERVAPFCTARVLDADLDKRIKARIRAGASPRHVPARIIAVADIPRTKSGKITELAVRDIVHGRTVKNKEALANPEALELFSNLPQLQD